MWSLAAALRMSVDISRSMTTFCLTLRSQSQMPMMHSVVSPLRNMVSIVAVCSLGRGGRIGKRRRAPAREVSCRMAVVDSRSRRRRRRHQVRHRPARARTDREVVPLARRQPQLSRAGRSWPRCRCRTRREDRRPGPPRRSPIATMPGAQAPVGADAAGDHQRCRAGLRQRPLALDHQRIDDGLLETAGDVGPRHWRRVRRAGAGRRRRRSSDR